MTFTNWNLITNFSAYVILTIAHVLNGDFAKSTYTEVDALTVDDSRRPYYLWPIATCAYEFAFTTALSVTMGYGCVETVFQHVTGVWKIYPWYFQVLGWAMHTLP